MIIIELYSNIKKEKRIVLKFGTQTNSDEEFLIISITFNSLKKKPVNKQD
jgi:hypothetical protein